MIQHLEIPDASLGQMPLLEESEIWPAAAVGVLYAVAVHLARIVHPVAEAPHLEQRRGSRPAVFSVASPVSAGLVEIEFATAKHMITGLVQQLVEGCLSERIGGALLGTRHAVYALPDARHARDGAHSGEGQKALPK